MPTDSLTSITSKAQRAALVGSARGIPSHRIRKVKRHNKTYNATWRKIRPGILERDGGLCQVQLEGCTKIATQVDHIHPLAYGGAPYDPDNLRASCASCNSTRANKARRRPSRQW